MNLTNLLLVLNAVCIIVVSHDVDRRITDIHNRTVYDLDVMRQEYIGDNNYTYMQACLNGANNYNPDGNANAMDWCGRERDAYEQQTLMSQISNWGKKRDCKIPNFDGF